MAYRNPTRKVFNDILILMLSLVLLTSFVPPSHARQIGKSISKQGNENGEKMEQSNKNKATMELGEMKDLPSLPDIPFPFPFPPPIPQIPFPPPIPQIPFPPPIPQFSLPPPLKIPGIPPLPTIPGLPLPPFNIPTIPFLTPPPA